MVEKQSIKIQTRIIALLVVFIMAMTFALTEKSYAATVALEKPVVKVSVAKTTVKLSWAKVPSAKQYQIYRATKKNGKYRKIKTTKSCTYKNTKLSTGKMYFYKVRAYSSGNKYSKFCYVEATPLGVPICKVNAQITMNKVRTNGVKGATGYQVYRSTNKESGYALIGTTKSLAYNDKSATYGTRYYYKMRGYKSSSGYTTCGPFSSVAVATRLLAIPKLEVEVLVDGEDPTLNEGIKATWSEVQAAEGYELLRSQDEGKTYTKIYSGTNLEYVDKTCADGRKYYYEVRAYQTVGGVRDYSYTSPSKHSRSKLVETAKAWLGYSEKNKKYKKLVDVYNAFKPLPRGMKGQYKEAWCTTFVTAAAIKSGMTDIMPRERICRYMIDLYKELGQWVEKDSYVPKPGDLIMYDWDDKGKGDCTGNPEHIGIVVSVSGKTIKVIEGNKANSSKGDPVAYRSIKVNARYIRGYATPLFDVNNGITFFKHNAEEITETTQATEETNDTVIEEID